jgi:Fungal protein kinase
MFRKKDGSIFGVLNDFDLSVFRNRSGASSKQRTGTRPFQAIDLLAGEAVEHRYRHDLESLFYVIVWITSRYCGGKEIKEPPLQEWSERGGVELQKEKRVFLTVPPPRATSDFEALEDCVERMRRALQEGFAARTNHEADVRRAAKVAAPPSQAFDYETLGGYVSFDVFRDILCPPISAPPS